jgi:hypothetical protein
VVIFYTYFNQLSPEGKTLSLFKKPSSDTVLGIALLALLLLAAILYNHSSKVEVVGTPGQCTAPINKPGVNKTTDRAPWCNDNTPMPQIKGSNHSFTPHNYNKNYKIKYL